MFQDVGEEGLGAVLGVLRRQAVRAQADVERIPVTLADFAERALCAGVGFALGIDDQ